MGNLTLKFKTISSQSIHSKTKVIEPLEETEEIDLETDFDVPNRKKKYTF